ncbi:G2/mitotic-specific cyclin-A [Drosophila subpulchrella]|uniref:G2/mitotic-specific cyclin-A n=1 Tax=Drosophila subpulchrella TaxID=1486046 RepID=UPI0018A1846B|nr:G2/mitotic-specific cyclin-A [Drosophila subpulchrella]
MASFQIHQVMSNKENPGIKIPAGVKNAKQPLAVIGKSEKNALAPRANFAVLNGNNNVPRPSGKVQVFRDVRNHNIDVEKVEFATKKSNVVPVVEQFKTFSVYEDNCDTQVAPPGKSLASLADKENQYAVKFDAGQKECVEYDLTTTPMSVTDVLSPMSVDRSILGVIQTNDDGVIGSGATPGGQLKELPPRNDRQRFFEVVQYQMDILENFRESEKKHRPKPMYMRRQKDISHNMRSILIDWLVEVSEEYKLDTETLYLSVFYLDRFLSLMAVVRSKLQLVGTAAMYIAAKYEEIYPPEVGEFVFLTDDSYTKTQVLRMEQVILKILSFDLCTPTAYVFINTYAVLCDMPERLKFLTLYISELSLMEGETYLQYLPSVMSSASLALARHILGMEMWTPQLEEITTYKLEDLKTVVLQLSHTHKTAKELNTQAMREKYNRDTYKKVAMIDSIELSKEDIDQLCQAYNAKQLNENQQQPENNSKSNVNLFYKF